MTPRELSQYLDALNEKNDFDLEWEYERGPRDEPVVKVYEQADRHELCSGDWGEIKINIQKALPRWRLEDV